MRKPPHAKLPRFRDYCCVFRVFPRCNNFIVVVSRHTIDALLAVVLAGEKGDALDKVCGAALAHRSVVTLLVTGAKLEEEELVCV